MRTKDYSKVDYSDLAYHLHCKMRDAHNAGTYWNMSVATRIGLDAHISEWYGRYNTFSNALRFMGLGIVDCNPATGDWRIEAVDTDPDTANWRIRH